MKIGLYINESCKHICGPLKVYFNLKKGLEKLGHEVVTNERGQLTGCLHNNTIAFTLPGNTPMGPNLFLWPKDCPDYFIRYKNFVIPSDWVAPIYTTSPLFTYHKIFSWSVGIDSEIFNLDRSPTIDCLIYFKNRDQNELENIKRILESHKQTYTIVEYGNYTEVNYLKLLKNSRYAILLTNTESQGIGYMEMLSTNLPCFVLNKNSYNGFPATSVPYFNDKCGIVTEFNSNLDKDFETFLESLSKFEPRSYILENHTLEISAKKYLDILNLCV